MSEQNKLNYEPVPLGNILLPPPLPKPAQPVEPRASVPKPELPAVKSSAIVESPKPPLPGRLAWVPEAVKALVRPSRQKGVIAAGLASLAAGVLAANFMWPAPPPVVEEAKAETAPPPLPEPKALIESPAMPATTIVVETQPVALPPLAIPLVDANVKPAGGVPEVPLPSPGALPPIIIPTDPAPPVVVAAAPPVILPDVSKLPVPKVEVKTPPAPAIPDLSHASPSRPDMKAPAAAPPVPAIPDIRLPVPSVPDIKPMPPVIPEVKPAPSVLPDVKAPPLEVKTVPPAATIVSPEPRPLPKVDPPVKPAAALAPREDYDVDVHYIAAGDSWSAISRQHLGDDRFAEALKAYNGNRVLSADQTVDVPPIHVLRRQYGHLMSAPRTASTPPELPPATVDGQRTWEVPAGGMSFKDVARKALGDENYWGRIWELNPKLRSDEPIPAGTRIVLPADARVN